MKIYTHHESEIFTYTRINRNVYLKSLGAFDDDNISLLRFRVFYSEYFICSDETLTYTFGRTQHIHKNLYTNSHNIFNFNPWGENNF